MPRFRWLSILLVACLLLAGCNKNQHKKPDPTKGAVSGIVICTDTGKPARFATVTLSAVPKKGEKAEDSDPLPAAETTVTDLEGRFRMEAVQPGHYFAFATLEGYLDPVVGLDLARLNTLSDDRERTLDAIAQWKSHLAEVTVAVHRVSEVSIAIERGAEISGTVSFDDGSPAIGMHFALFRKTEKSGWTDVGLPLLDNWTIHTVSDGHGRFSLTNLPAGEYTVCALMPSEAQDSAPRVCLGGVFRRKDAKTIKVQAGESANGADIEIPLAGMHTVAGSVSAVSDGHDVGQGTVRLLYADDREKMRETALVEDGSFSFEYVPEGKYILQVSAAQDVQPAVSEPNGGTAEPPNEKAHAIHRYADKEMPVVVLDNLDDIQVQLAAAGQEKPQSP